MLNVAGYVVGTLLGQGTYGQTFEATKNGQRFALKLIRAEALRFGFDPRRFQREVRALQKAAGPHVVEIMEAGETKVGKDLRYYIVMEYLEGCSLAQAFRDAGLQFDEPRLKSILTQIVSGLKSIYEQNIIHRDLKPENVFVTPPALVTVVKTAHGGTPVAQSVIASPSSASLAVTVNCRAVLIMVVMSPIENRTGGWFVPALHGKIVCRLLSAPGEAVFVDPPQANAS